MTRAFTTARCLGLLHQFEGKGGKFEPVPTQDCHGNWEIGWGHKLGSPDYAGSPISAETADALAVQDLWHAADAASAALSPPISLELTQGQWDAVVCFTYNVGGHAFQTSTMCRLLRFGQRSQAAAEFDRWIFGHDPVTHKVVEDRGLVRRRAAEKAIYQS